MNQIESENTLIQVVYNNLKLALKESGLTREKLAEILDLSTTTVCETFKEARNMKLRTVASYAWAMGYRVEIRFVPRETQPLVSPAERVTQPEAEA